MPRSKRSAGWLRRILLGVLALALLSAGAAAYLLRKMNARPPMLSEEARCHAGAYETSAGELLAVRQRDGEELRVVYFDGRTRGVSREDGGDEYRSGGEPALTVRFAPCAEGTLTIGWGETAPLSARRIRFEERESRFAGQDVELAGRLVLPVGAERVPIVVLVHGSEKDSALDGNDWQYLLPARGVGAFVYDKRGTGRSTGTYSQNFDLLSADAIAAASEARRLAGERAAAVGFLGTSQGGWVAPLAASRMTGRGGADFVAVAYGLAESPLAEDRDEVAMGLRDAGFGDAETLAKARELTDATGRVMASRFQDGFDQLDAVKEKYGKEPWFAHVEGEFTGDFLRFPPSVLKITGPRLDVGTSWDYDPMPTLESIDAPHLWVIAGADREAPSERTFALLRDLQSRRPNLDVARFPDADHGIWVERPNADGSRYSGYAPGYYELVVRWIQTHSLAGTDASIETYEGGATPSPEAAAPPS